MIRRVLLLLFLAALPARALKTTSGAGTAPSGMRIVHALHDSVGGQLATKIVEFPSSGNLLVLGWASGAGRSISSVASSPSNTFSDTTCGFIGSDVQMFYAGNATTTNDATITPSFTGVSTADHSMVYYDIAGAAASPFDLCGSATGIQSVAGNLTTSNVTPTTPSGLVLNVTGINAGTLTGTVGAGFLFHSTTYGGETSPAPADQNNGWAGFFNTNTNNVSFVFTNNAATGVQDWSSISTAFKAPAAPAGAPHQLTTLGCCAVALMIDDTSLFAFPERDPQSRTFGTGCGLSRLVKH